MFWIVLLLLILVVFGLGFSMQLLWWVAAVMLALWIVAYAVRARSGGRRRHSRGRRYAFRR